MQETILDIQSRSMRDNLIFSGIPESSTEDPEKSVKDFLINQLKLSPETVEHITFHRVHRLGQKHINSTRSRPIIAKFEHFKQKVLVQRQGRQLKGTHYGLNDQYPQEIIRRRKLLFPIRRTMINQDAQTDEMISVSVMEGDSITLNSDVTEILRYDRIMWFFGPSETRITDIYDQVITIYDQSTRFKDKLQLDSQTGSLTIKNIRTTNSGLYKLNVLSQRGVSHKTFTVTVFAPVSTPVLQTIPQVSHDPAPLPIPVITSDSSQCSSSSSSSSSSSRSSVSRCSLVCSVLNVSDVTLSWYKGVSVLSSISVCDLSISLSLEVEYQDKNTYSCVLNNPVRNQTTHLDITQLCQPCEDSVQCCGFTEAVIRLVVSALVGVAIVAVLIYDIKSNQINQERRAHEHHHQSLTDTI
ncbi:uncharacterized protein LOC130078197 [Rhinichthys klamathensis goyatoka]|uniref:uncharacterized protein LOC130078197 n=1 Tax=Rhinichthys klamathensis goyatoka TaxID=3034132 RepID=UPI0024B499A3|nr:uncharacterized protein LOC130078197 [Rhinichthys klamathensis goyatoka]